MSNKNKQNENKKDQQPTTPAAQVELSEEELQQVTGGFDPKPDVPGMTALIRDPGL